MLAQVVGVRHQDIGHARQWPRHHRGRQGVGCGNADGQIQPLGGQVGHGIGHGHLYLHLGPACAKARQQRRQPPVAKHQWRVDAQHALGLLAVRRCARYGQLGALQHLQAVGVHGSTHFGERQRTRGAMQQLDAQLRFQPSHTAAYSAGGEPQLAGRPGKALVGHHLCEYLHIGQRKRVGSHGSGLLSLLIGIQ
ncbi:hypothetical protein D3C72_1713160 [compost metagenome]